LILIQPGSSPPGAPTILSRHRDAKMFFGLPKVNVWDATRATFRINSLKGVPTAQILSFEIYVVVWPRFVGKVVKNLAKASDFQADYQVSLRRARADSGRLVANGFNRNRLRLIVCEKDQGQPAPDVGDTVPGKAGKA
jgi:hypothetical protein